VASSKRERELARQRAVRQAARRAQRERRRKQRNAVIATVIAVAVVAGAAAYGTVATRGGDDALASDPTPSPSAEPAGDGECSYRPAGQPARPIEPPGPDIDRTTPYRAVLETDQGPIGFTLRTADAPCAVHSFRHLAGSDWFDGTPCHRLTAEGIFVLQCGDPTGKGTGGPGYTFADENLTGATYERGTVAMANSGPDTNGSQFFICLDNVGLPPQYSVFGEVTAGMEVVDRIAKVPLRGESPRETVFVERVTRAE
jgi:peptidyl-prolyl cis-trans isomerase B (cyclophilin B)